MTNTLPAVNPRNSKITSLTQTSVAVAHSMRRVATHRGGQRWQIELDYPPLKRDEVAELWTFLNAQYGPAGSFYFVLPNLPRRGTVSGSPVVQGADQRGSRVQTSGWPPNGRGLLRVGDFIRFEGHYKTYQITADVSADASGEAELEIFPMLQDAPYDGNAVVSDNRFRVALTTDEQEVSLSRMMHFGLSVTLIEVLT